MLGFRIKPTIKTLHQIFLKTETSTSMKILQNKIHLKFLLLTFAVVDSLASHSQLQD